MVDATRTYICQVSSPRETLTADEENAVVVTINAVRSPGPYLIGVGIGPFDLSASDVVNVHLDEYFSGATSFALGTVDPATNASAAAVYTANTMILAITADATRTGTTTFPVTATGRNNLTASADIQVVVS